MAQAKKVQLGVMGCGRIAGSRILPALLDLPVDLKAVCDLDDQKASEFMDRFGAKASYRDYHKMFAEEELEGIIIAVGPEAHWRMSIEAMERGIHVFTEKPPSCTAAQAREVLEVSRKTGMICMTGFKKRYAPVFRKAKEIIERADFGQPLLLSIDRHDALSINASNRKAWFLLDVAIHVIDAACFLFGRPAEVFSWNRNDSCYAVSIKFASGALGTLSLSCHRSSTIPSETFEITGDPGRFITINNSIELLYYKDDQIADWHGPNFATSKTNSLVETGFSGELNEFVTSVREKRKPQWDIESSFQTMRLLEAIRDSGGSRLIL